MILRLYDWRYVQRGLRSHDHIHNEQKVTRSIKSGIAWSYHTRSYRK